MQSTCPNSDILRSFLDGSLHDASADGVVEHVEYCESCRDVLDEWSGDKEVQLWHQQRHELAAKSSPVLEELINRLSLHIPAEVLGKDIQHRLTRSDWVTFPEPPGQGAPLGRIGRYNVIERIASGGTGLLYKAVDTQLDRTVALKVLRSELAETESYQARLEREARVAASLNHDHIVTLYEIRIEGDFPPCLVMEYVVGESLRERIERTQVLGPREAARIVCEVGSALSTAHNQNLVHRDVKPANIMLDVATGRAKLTDFGLARDEDATTRITVEGAIAGTPAYMSPEQITTPNEVDARSDVYSLGVVLYECLSGRVPFAGVVRMALQQALHSEPQSLTSLNDQVPRDLETICAKAMCKDPGRRYQSAKDFADDLQRFLRDEPIRARPVSKLERFSRWCRNNVAIALLSGSLVATLLVITVGATLMSVKLADTAAEYRDISVFALHELINNSWRPDAPEEEILDEIEFRQSLIEPLERAGTEDPVIAEAKQQTGDMLYVIGRQDEAEQLFLQSAELLERKAAEDPDDTYLDHLLVTTYTSLARVEADKSNWDDADAYMLKSLKLLGKLEKAEPENMDVLHKLAHIHGVYAEIYKQRNDAPQMVRQLALEWEQLDLLYEREGERPELLFQMYDCCDKLVDGEIEQGRISEAQARAEDAASIGGDVVRMFPMEEFTREHDMSFGPHHNLPFSSSPFPRRPIDIARRLVFHECFCAAKHIEDDDLGDALDGHVYRAMEYAQRTAEEDESLARKVQNDLAANRELLRPLFHHPATKKAANELLAGDLSLLSPSLIPQDENPDRFDPNVEVGDGDNDADGDSDIDGE